jgi:hypothetical protein
MAASHPLPQFEIAFWIEDRSMNARMCRLAIVCMLGAVVVASTASAADVDNPGRLTERQLRESGFTPLVKDSSLDGWDVQPWHEGHWVANGGVIDYDGKASHQRFDKNSLWTVDDYGDVELYCEWRLPSQPSMKSHPIVLFNGDFLRDEEGKRITRRRLDAGDSGIFFRGTPKCQANIWSQELGSGEINGYRTDQDMSQEVRRAAIPIKKADRPLGEWNTFLITLKDNHMTVVLNGEKVIGAAPLPGLPKTGPIGLQHHGDPVQFRNLWVKRLD